MSDHPETAPWGTLPGDKDDPNYGRECIRCKGAIRAGLRHAHTCPQHPETVSMRLAEAATEATGSVGPWKTSELYEDLSVLTRVRAPGGLMRADVWAWHGDKARQALASHIAHAHPGRVRAWLGCVARLRERVAEGHSSECVKRFRPAMACKCGHEDDVAALGAVDAEG